MSQFERPPVGQPVDAGYVEAAISIALKTARFRRLPGTVEHDEICKLAAAAVTASLKMSNWMVVHGPSEIRTMPPPRCAACED